jgi:hypothetical protein
VSSFGVQRMRAREMGCLTGGVSGLLEGQGGRGMARGGEWPTATVQFKDLAMKAPITMKMKWVTLIDGGETEEEVERRWFHVGEVA